MVDEGSSVSSVVVVVVVVFVVVTVVFDEGDWGSCSTVSWSSVLL